MRRKGTTVPFLFCCNLTNIQMQAYIPIKWRPGKLTRNYQPFKFLQDAIKQKEYLVRDECTFKSTNIFTDNLEEYQSTPTVRELATLIYKEKIEQDFPNFWDAKKLIVRTFEAVQHRDCAWNRGLFLSLVVHADPNGHVLVAAPADFSPRANLANFRMMLKAGDIFIMDPSCIHSVHNRSKEKKELVLLQWELEYANQEEALKVLQNCNYEFVNLA